MSLSKRSLSHETMLELMQYADGELAGEARARVEGLLQTSEEARRVVEAMGGLGDVVREGVEARLDAAAIEGITESVMAAIAVGVAAARQDAVVPLAPRRAAKRFGVYSATLAVLALAAGLALFIRFQAGDAGSLPEGYYGSSPPGALASESPSAHKTAAEVLGVDLEEVRSVENKVDVFFTPPAKSASASVVVWIDDSHGEH